MNIIVKIYNSDLCVCRPDTSWERENKDLYMPDEMGGYHFSPIVFARISKAGKRIGTKFAERYYDGIGYGALLYDSDLIGVSPAGFAAASCEDHTSIIPFPLYNPITLGGDNRFDLKMDGRTVFETGTEGAKEALEDAICKASAKISLRIGDIVAVELDATTNLISRKETDTEGCESHKLEGVYCENSTFDFKIIL